jgi:hypothetical protein
LEVEWRLAAASIACGYLLVSTQALTERYTLADSDRFDAVINFVMTLEDPVMLAEPYVVEKAWSWASDLELLTYDCILRDRPTTSAQ